MKTKTGIFIMRRSDSGFRNLFEGVANGFVCKMRIGLLGRFSSSVRHPDGRTYHIYGQSYTLDGIVTFLSKNIDSLFWDGIASDPDADVQYVRTKKGNIAYHGYNTHLDGAPVVFLHGGPGDSANPLKPRMMMLDSPVYCYDQLGCGKSAPIPDLERWSHKDYFDELNEFLLLVGIRKAVLVGASWGAGLAVGFAEKYGCSRIEKLVLVSPFLSSEIWERDQKKNMSALPENERRQLERYAAGEIRADECRKELADYLSRYLFTRERNREIAESAAAEEHNEVFKAMCGDNDFKITGSMKDFDLVPGLDKITVPTLLMCGDSDEVRVETLLSFAEKIRDSRVSVVPYAGHALSSEQFEIYSQTVRDFLSEPYPQR